MPWESDRRVQVQLDVIAQPEPFTYLLPSGMDVALGAEVVVPLRGRRVTGWVVPVDEAPFCGELRHIVRLRRPAGPPGAVQAALGAAKWYCTSSVYFLRQTLRPKVGGCAQPQYQQLPPDEPLQPTDVPVELLWTRLDTPGVTVASDLIASGDLGVRGMVIVATDRMVERCVGELRRRGVLAAAVSGGWDALAMGHLDVSVGTRSASLAPVERPEFCVVIDPIDPSCRSEAAPYFEALDLARVRCGIERIPLHVVTATPPLALSSNSIKRQPPRAVPALSVCDRQVFEEQDGGISGWIAREVPSWRRRAGGGELSLIVPSSGANAAVVCVACGAVCNCERCGGRLRPVHRDPEGTREVERLRSRLRIDELVCPSCLSSSAPRCRSCHGTALRLRGLSLDRFGAELEGRLREPVVVWGQKKRPEGQCRVGTQGLLDYLRPREVVVFVGLDRFVPYGSLIGRPLMWYLLHRALVAQAGLVVVFVSGDAGAVANELARGDLARLNREDTLQRSLLSLPPFRAMAVWHGVDTERVTGALHGELEIRQLAPDQTLVIAQSEAMLHEIMASRERIGGRIEFSPRILRSS